MGVRETNLVRGEEEDELHAWLAEKKKQFAEKKQFVEREKKLHERNSRSRKSFFRRGGLFIIFY